MNEGASVKIPLCNQAVLIHIHSLQWTTRLSFFTFYLLIIWLWYDKVGPFPLVSSLDITAYTKLLVHMCNFFTIMK